MTPRTLLATNALGLLWLMFEIALTAGGIAATRHGGLAPWIVGQLLLAVAMWRWFVVLHSCGHRACFRSRWLNDLVGLIASIGCAVPYFPWRHVHRKHHVWTGWRDLDPTLKTAGPLSPRRRRIFDFCWKYWVPLLSVVFAVSTFWNVRHANTSTPTRWGRRLNALSVAWLILVYGAGAAILGLDLLPLAGLAFFLYCSVSDLSVLSQHVYLPMHNSNGSKVKPFPLVDQDQFSRTMVMPQWASRWLFSGFNLHSVHHAYPWVPHYLSHRVQFEPAHTMPWRQWLGKTKSMPAHILFLFDGADATGLGEGHDSRPSPLSPP